MNSTVIAVIITACICSLFSSSWILGYNATQNEWMYVVAGGPVLWIWFGIVSLVNKLIKVYRRYTWKAVVVDKDGNKYWCDSNKLEETEEKYDVKPAFEFAKNTEFKPYHPNDCIIADNPRYVHRSVLKNIPKITDKE